MACSMTRPSTIAFLVGWIAALPHELAAACSILDEEFEIPPDDFVQPATDTNSYIWGRVGNHCVVIATLPGGVYGLCAATEVAARLSSSLPHIRLGLMVGIAAGVPSRGIRLGDVVVSRPDGTLGGVVQYDQIKAKVDNGEQVDERTGFLNRPPTSLLTALSKWQARHEMGKSQITSILTEAISANPYMEQRVGYQGADNDPLRKDETRDEDNRMNSPVVHLGIVASGNKLIKSAQERDRLLALLERENIFPICFEMEAAGLMNAFPCLVVRGICDYADEWKNDVWQRYAALAAASFSKELLLLLNPSMLQAETSLLERLGSIHQDVHEMKLDSTFLKQKAAGLEFNRVLDWLCPTEYADMLHEHSKSYQEGTCRRFLEHPKYVHWAHGGMDETGRAPSSTGYGSPSSSGFPQVNQNVLFCTGHEGTGKTVIAALVVRSLLHSQFSADHPIIYIFFDYSKREMQTPEHVLSALLRQFAFAKQEIPEAIASLHSTHATRNTRPTFIELIETAHESFRAVKSAHIVLDALDECSDNVAKRILGAIRPLVTAFNLKLLATSRCVPQILELFPQFEGFIIAAVAEDVAVYARSQLDERLGADLVSRAALIDKAVDVVVETAGHMFLLARLLVELLVEADTPGDLHATLEAAVNDPKSLHWAYSRTLNRIKQQSPRRSERAMEALGWVVRAKRPLSTEELQHALAFSIDDESLRKDRVPSIETVISQCKGLLTVETRSNTVRVTHYTAYRFLLIFLDTEPALCSSPFKDLKMEDILACKCITYITLTELMGSESGPQSKDDVALRYPLFLYAAVNWGEHARSLQDSMLNWAVSRLKDSCRAFSTLAVSRWYDAEIISASSMKATVWHALAIHELTSLFRTIVCQAVYSDAPDERGLTPLAWAAKEGCLAMVQAILCTNSADVTRQDRLGNTPLYWAVKAGHRSIVAALLDQGFLEEQMRRPPGRPTMTYVAVESHDSDVTGMIVSVSNMPPAERLAFSRLLSQRARGYLLGPDGLGLARHIKKQKIINTAPDVDVDAFDWLLPVVREAKYSGPF